MDGPYHQMHSSSDDPDYTEFTEGPKEKTNHDFDVKWTNKEKASEEDDKEGERRGRCRLGKKVPHAEEASPMEEAPWA
jgi:hypothetical protein